MNHVIILIALLVSCLFILHMLNKQTCTSYCVFCVLVWFWWCCVKIDDGSLTESWVETLNHVFNKHTHRHPPSVAGMFAVRASIHSCLKARGCESDPHPLPPAPSPLPCIIDPCAPVRDTSLSTLLSHYFFFLPLLVLPVYTVWPASACLLTFAFIKKNACELDERRGTAAASPGGEWWWRRAVFPALGFTSLMD